MNRNLIIAIIAGSTSTALAQLGTGLVTWEANDGSGWTSGRLETTAPSVEVRMKAQWEPQGDNSVGFGFAGMQFDAVVTSPAGTSDTVTNPLRPGNFAQGSSQTLVVSRFANQIKIDDSRDTLPPGLGPRGVFPGQLAPQFGIFDRSNPAVIFTFRLNFDTAPGLRRVNSLYIAPSNGDTISRYLRLFTSGSGTQNIPNTTTLPLELVFIPAPGTAAIAAGATLLLTKRRR